MNYNRYLDLHLCTSGKIALLKTTFIAKAKGDRKEIQKIEKQFFTHKGTSYFYDFAEDFETQAQYRSQPPKAEGFVFDPDAKSAKNNSRNFAKVEITTADEPTLVLRPNGEISDELKRLRYIGCMVAIEQLQTQNVYPNLEGLVHWINDKTTTNKLRINCHGSGTSAGGFNMDDDLSVDDFVAALVRHGLTRQGTLGFDAEKRLQNLSGLAHNARWKFDSEVTKCENPKCAHLFKKKLFSSTKHHCRRCGGIFCDKCTQKRVDLRVALTGPDSQTATATNVRNQRVCDSCYKDAQDKDRVRDAVDGELKYGLQTIALGLCLGARADTVYSPEGTAAGQLAAGSLACRFRDALTTHNLRGIKITASNTVVANNAKIGLQNQFGVHYPGRRGVTTRSLNQTGELCFPAYIWGDSKVHRDYYINLPDPKPAPGILVSGDSILFGYGPPLPPPTAPTGPTAPSGPTTAATGGSAPVAAPPPLTPDRLHDLLEREFFNKWKFTSWGEPQKKYYTESGAGPHDRCCIELNTPPRVATLENVPNPPNPPSRTTDTNVIRVVGRQKDNFKQWKAHGVS